MISTDIGKKQSIKKILLIKLKGIGDVVLSTIAVNNLLQNLPGCKIDYLTEKPSLPFLKNLPEVNHVFVLPKKLFDRIDLIKKIRKEKYDLLIDFYSNPTTAIISFLSGAVYRAGFPYRVRKYAYNIYGPPERDKFHAAQLHLEMLKNLNLKCSSTELLFGFDEEDRKTADDFFSADLNNDRLIFGISPSGGWNSKKCEPEKFAEIADAAAEEYNAQIFILWGPEDKDDALSILRLMKNKPILAPPTSICLMGAMISRCDALIANDSGPMHISTAVGTPVLSLHGPTSPRMQGPFGDKHEWVRLDELECIECNLLECPRGHECFKELPVEKVLSKFKLLLEKNGLI